MHRHEMQQSNIYRYINYRILFLLEKSGCYNPLGFTQCLGVDYNETSSPIIKPATIQTVLTLAISRHWPVHQLNIKNAFLHGTLSEMVYWSQPTGFVDPAHLQLVCQLHRIVSCLLSCPHPCMLHHEDVNSSRPRDAEFTLDGIWLPGAGLAPL
jgi:hypothetical protein